jgi:hypothetical protein
MMTTHLSSCCLKLLLCDRGQTALTKLMAPLAHSVQLPPIPSPLLSPEAMAFRDISPQ